MFIRATSTFMQILEMFAEVSSDLWDHHGKNTQTYHIHKWLSPTTKYIFKVRVWESIELLKAPTHPTLPHPHSLTKG